MSVLLFSISSTSVLSKPEQIVTLMMDIHPTPPHPPHTTPRLVSGHCSPLPALPRDGKAGESTSLTTVLAPSVQREQKTTLHTDFISTDKFGGMTRHWEQRREVSWGRGGSQQLQKWCNSRLSLHKSIKFILAPNFTGGHVCVRAEGHSAVDVLHRCNDSKEGSDYPEVSAHVSYH